MIGLIPIAGKTSFIPKNPNRWEDPCFCMALSCKPPLFRSLRSWHVVVWTGLSRSVTGSSWCLGRVVQEVSLGSYLGPSCAKTPCRRAASPLRLLAMRSFFERKEIVIYINGKKLQFWRNQTLLCEVSSTEGAKYYAMSILLLFFRKKWETNYAAFLFFFRCAEHILNWKPSFAFLRASEHSCPPQNKSL